MPRSVPGWAWPTLLGIMCAYTGTMLFLASLFDHTQGVMMTLTLLILGLVAAPIPLARYSILDRQTRRPRRARGRAE